jgi:DNA-binding MurR/RpiR family transcriptional regulator
MGVLQRMASLQDSFSNAELKLFTYIKEYPENVPQMTANDLAHASGVSAPSVVRFSKKLGFQSLSDFKINLSSDLKSMDQETLGYADLEPNESFNSIKQKMVNNTKITLSETTDLLDETTITETVKLIEQKKHGFTFGIGASHLAAEDIVQKWTRVGNAVVFEKDLDVLLPELINNVETSYLWLISTSGETPQVLALAKTAKKLGIPVIALTRFGDNSLTKLATISIQFARPQEPKFRSAATNSIISQFMTIDIIFYLYISRNKENAGKIRSTRQLIDEFRKDFYQ